jgi:transposase
MKLSDHNLRQLDEHYLYSLETEALRVLSVKLLSDLKEARERLNQGPENSSRPPSSREPWQKHQAAEDRGEDESEEESGVEEDEHAPEMSQDAGEQAQRAPVAANSRRKAGKQPGAAGHGRTQVLEAQETVAHYATHCAGCGKGLDDQEGAVAYTAFQEIDLKWGDSAQPGLHLHVIKHLYYEQTCPCGHGTRAEAHRGEVDPLLEGVKLSEWRVAGPGMAALIVALALRFRLSRARIREFLWDWLGLAVSTGTISRTLHEAGAAIAPAEEQRVQEILESGLLHADETPWKEQGHALWLWVFTSLSVTLYYVAHRGKELVENLLEHFDGWLMSDGWIAYRWLPKRLRC